jgi:hypothetical protein
MLCYISILTKNWNAENLNAVVDAISIVLIKERENYLLFFFWHERILYLLTNWNKAHMYEAEIVFFFLQPGFHPFLLLKQK